MICHLMIPLLQDSTLIGKDNMKYTKHSTTTYFDRNFRSSHSLN